MKKLTWLFIGKFFDQFLNDLPSGSTDGTDAKRDCPLLTDAWIKLIEIWVKNVKLIEEVESY